MQPYSLYKDDIFINIIQVYAPTTEADEENIEEFYEDIEKVLRQCKNHELNIIMGDLNSKVGKGRTEQIVGPFGLGERNERGEKFVEWCQEKNQIIMNTWFRHQTRHLWTWKSPGDRIRNQIDYITINERFRNLITQVKTYPGADANSDHVPAVATIRLRSGS